MKSPSEKKKRSRADGKVLSRGRRAEVLATAIRAFSAKGYQQVSLKEIADEMGITKAALYYYYPKKQEILGEALEYAGRILTERIKEVVEQDLPPDEKLQMILEEHTKHVLAHRELFSVYFSDAGQLDAVRREESLKGERWYARTVAKTIDEGVKQGLLRELHPQVTALALLGMCNSAVRWFQPVHGLPASEMAKYLAETALRGVVAQKKKR